MPSILWMQDGPRRGRWWRLALIVVLGAAAVMWLSRPQPSRPPALEARAPAPALRSERAVPAPLPDKRAAPSPAVAEAAPPPVHCPYQQLDIALGEKRVRGCVASTRISQAGDLRTYVLEPQGVSVWTLRIESGEGRVMAASLSAPGEGEYRCEAVGCSGFSIGPRDAHGSRSLSVREAVLQRDGAGGGGESGKVEGPGSLSLSARLAVAGDQQHPDFACTGSSISIVEKNNAAFGFCASSTGLAQLDDGRQVFSLRGLEGDLLVISVDAAGQIDRVEFAGLVCSGSACAGATMQAGEGNADRERSFVFSGTSLNDGHAGGRSAMLNGSAFVPAL